MFCQICILYIDLFHALSVKQLGKNLVLIAGNAEPFHLSCCGRVLNYRILLPSIERWEASNSFGHSQREVRCQTHIVFKNRRARPSLIPFIDSRQLTPLHRVVSSCYLLRRAARHCEILAQTPQIQHLSRNIWWDRLRPCSVRPEWMPRFSIL